MTEEQRARDLLTAAAELPDLTPAPVERLIATGRRRRALNRVLTAAAAAVAVAVAVTIPAAIRGGAPHRAPAPRTSPPALTTAAELARYHWMQLPGSPLQGKNLVNFVAAWTGRELVVAGDGGTDDEVEGAAYVPGVGWHTIAAIPDGLGTSIWGFLLVGNDLVVLHRSRPGAAGPAFMAAIYVPAANRWSVFAFPLPVTSDAGQLRGASFGDQIVFAEPVAGRVEAYAYSPTAMAGHRLSVPLPRSHKVVAVSMATVGQRVILWSTWKNGRTSGAARSRPAGVDVREMTAGGGWHTATGWPQGLRSVWPQSAAGGQIFLAPNYQPPATYGVADLVNGDTLAVRAVPAAPLVPRQEGGGRSLRYVPGLWTGAAVIAFAADYGENFGPEIFHDNMAALDPVSGHWYRLQSGPPRYTIVWPLTPIWAGDRMYVTNGAVLWSLGP
jgi:hypothetical protein